MASERPTHQQVVDATLDHEAEMRPQSVPINMYEASEALVIVAILPAVTPDDVTIELRPGTVRFWSHLRSAGPREYLVQEWEYGGYDRTIDLPEGFGSGVEASLTNGQLVIRVLRGIALDDIDVKPIQASE